MALPTAVPSLPHSGKSPHSESTEEPLLAAQTRGLVASLCGCALGCDDQDVQVESTLLEYDVVEGHDQALSRATLEQCWCRGTEEHRWRIRATVVWRRVGPQWQPTRWHFTQARHDVASKPALRTRPRHQPRAQPRPQPRPASVWHGTA